MLKKLLKKMNAVLTSANTSLGFTLIELLIVIVIIGILAGVLIAVINPAQQQNRAKDANVQATINKFALSISGYQAAYGVLPTGAQFFSSVSNTPVIVSGCAAAFDCVFTYPPTALPVGNCNATAANSWLPNGAGQCAFRYVTTGAAAASFDIYAASFGRPTEVFRYNSVDSSIKVCPGTSAVAAAC